MSEFFKPTLGEFLVEYENLTIVNARPFSEGKASMIFSEVNSFLDAPLSRDSRTDYYQPERAALVLSTFYHLRHNPDWKRGGVAWVTTAVKNREGSLKGIAQDICRGFALIDQLKIPKTTKQYIMDVLKEQDYPLEITGGAGELVKMWLEETRSRHRKPMAVWFEEQALVAAE